MSDSGQVQDSMKVVAVGEIILPTDPRHPLYEEVPDDDGLSRHPA